MRKAYMIHGSGGRPNGGWRPWLMTELAKIDVYASALPMPTSEKMICSEWVGELAHHAERDKDDELYLVGHSLGVAVILRFLEQASPDIRIAGAVLVSGPIENDDDDQLADFFETEFDFEAIKKKVSAFAVIHGDDDPVVPVSQGERMAKALGCELTIVPNGKHLNGSAGWLALPQALEALQKMFM